MKRTRPIFTAAVAAVTVAALFQTVWWCSSLHDDSESTAAHTKQQSRAFAAARGEGRRHPNSTGSSARTPTEEAQRRETARRDFLLQAERDPEARTRLTVLRRLLDEFEARRFIVVVSSGASGTPTEEEVRRWTLAGERRRDVIASQLQGEIGNLDTLSPEARHRWEGNESRGWEDWPLLPPAAPALPGQIRQAQQHFESSHSAAVRSAVEDFVKSDEACEKEILTARARPAGEKDHTAAVLAELNRITAHDRMFQVMTGIVQQHEKWTAQQWKGYEVPPEPGGFGQSGSATITFQ